MMKELDSLKFYMLGGSRLVYFLSVSMVAVIKRLYSRVYIRETE